MKKENIMYSLYSTYFGELFVNHERNTEFDKHIKDVALFDEKEKSITILDKRYDNNKFISWLLSKHNEAKIIHFS